MMQARALCFLSLLCVAAWLLWGAAPAQAHGGQPKARSVFVDPIGAGELLAVVSTDLGLHVSRDGGQSWYWICEDATSFDVMDFALAGDPTGRPEDRVWLSAGVGLSDLGEVIPGLYASRDGGCNWEPVGGALAQQWVSALSVNPGSPREVLAASAHSELPNGVAISQDAGLTWAWTQLEGLSSPVTALVRAPSDPQVVYASTRDGLWRSGDGGRGWEPVAADLLQEDYEEPRVHAVDPEDPQVLWASVSGGRFTVWVSRDGGQSWTWLRDAEEGSVLSFSVLPGQGPQRRVLVVGRITQADRSLDSGQTWESYDTPIPVECLVADPAQEGAAYQCSNPSLQLLRPQAVARSASQGQEAEPWFAYSDTTDHLQCVGRSDICEVCVLLDNPDVTTDPCGQEPGDGADGGQDLPGAQDMGAASDVGQGGAGDVTGDAAGDAGGCGCRQVDSVSTGGAPWWFLALSLVWVWRRRQARSTQSWISSGR